MAHTKATEDAQACMKLQASPVPCTMRRETLGRGAPKKIASSAEKVPGRTYWEPMLISCYFFFFFFFFC